MRSFSFYPRLAAANMKSNRKFYLPYLITCIATVCMFYLMCFLANNQGLSSIRGFQYLSSMLNLGCIVIALFSVIFLFYTNSFLIKRRQKELGLYNILGMGKSNIAGVLFFETLYTAIISLIMGLGLGILLSRLILSLLCGMVGYSVTIAFEISSTGILYSLCLFCGIFLIILLYNLIKIKLSNPIQLLRSGNVGEKEPKSKWILTILGILCLGGGYYIAITTESPLQAIMLFFVAVILVIIGTYLLFTTGSISILKRLKSNPNYYYKAKNFIPVSGMIYRMKQNAVGLGNICILSTMVLVMVSGTLSLYIGTESTLKKMYPTDVSVLASNPTGNAAENIETAVKNAVSESGVSLLNDYSYQSLAISAAKKGDVFEDDTPNYMGGSDNTLLYFISAEEYEKMTGSQVKLLENQVLSYSGDAHLSDTFLINNREFSVKERLESFPVIGSENSLIMNEHYLVVSGETYSDILSKSSELHPSWRMGFDLDCSSDEKMELSGTINDALSNALCDSDGNANEELGGYDYACAESSEENRGYVYAMNGGFLFLGIFLGIVFIMAAGLIMYYKQLSEGYDDHDRYEIMQKVGLSRPEIKRSIKSQILMVFFLPLATAVLHIAFAFKMITKLLSVLNLYNITLFAMCTAGTVLVFALIYLIIYSLTAREYYKIVS